MAIKLSIPKFESLIRHNPLSFRPNGLHVAIFTSLILHAVILFGVSFKIPTPDFDKVATSLEVVLVNNKTQSKPNKAELFAQADLDGGGNTDEDRRAKTPFPVLPENQPSTDDLTIEQKSNKLELEAKKLTKPTDNNKQSLDHPDTQMDIKNPSDTAHLPKKKPILASNTAQQKVHQLELETQSLMTAAKDVQTDQSDAQQVPSKTVDLLQRSLEIARLKAQIAQDHDTYQKRPKRRFIGARTKEYRFARYVEDWRIKVERIGNLNYPEAARKGKLYGNLQLTVGIKADGSLESIGINRSSGEEILDQAAIRIVRLAGKNGFASFPPEISRDTDILHITRTWVFARSDKLISR